MLQFFRKQIAQFHDKMRWCDGAEQWFLKIPFDDKEMERIHSILITAPH